MSVALSLVVDIVSFFPHYFTDRRIDWWMYSTDCLRTIDCQHRTDVVVVEAEAEEAEGQVADSLCSN